MAQSSQPRHGPTAADHQLARDASALGSEPVSAWQVKRWREAGLLPTTRRFLGQGLGSEPVSYPAHAAAHAACLADALTTYTRLDEACLVCFMRGHTPPEKALKRAYAAEYQRLRDWIDRTTDGIDDQNLIAYAVGKLLSRRSAGIPSARAARERVKDAGKPASVFRNALAEAVSVFVLGLARRVSADTLLALGADGLLAPIGALGALATPDDLRLDWLNLDALTATVAEASLPELERARDDWNFTRELATTFASVVSRTHGLRLDAFLKLDTDTLGTAALVGIPGVILVRNRVGSETFDRNLDLLRREIPRAQATRRLLDAVPPEFHRHADDPTALAALAEDDRKRLLTAMQAHFDAHPDDLALLQDADDSENASSNKSP